MNPVGHIAMRHGVRLTRPVKACMRWLDQIPR
jgi:chromosome partitioning protein